MLVYKYRSGAVGTNENSIKMEVTTPTEELRFPKLSRKPVVVIDK